MCSKPCSGGSIRTRRPCASGARQSIIPSDSKISQLTTREKAQPVLGGTMTDGKIADILDTLDARDILKMLGLFR